MPRQLPRLVLAALTLNAALLAGALAAPSLVLGCSCAEPEPGAARFRGDEGVVVVGVVGASDGLGNYAFTVERLFRGDVPPVATLGSARQVFADGTEAWNSCGRDHTPGLHVILAGGFEDGVINAGICSPYETINSAEGQALLEEALELFGPGQVPGEPVPSGEAGAAGVDLATIAIAVVLGLLAIIVASVVVASIGRGGHGEPGGTAIP